MEAAIFNGVGKALTIERIADPEPGPGDVLVRVSRCGICGSDLHMTEDPIFNIPQGTVLGHEFAGEVLEVGRDVTGVRRGDHVCVVPMSSCGTCAECLAGRPAYCVTMQLHGGGYAELAAVNARQCVSLPRTVSLSDGALVEPLAVGLHGVIKAGMQPGARVLVVGAGPIGLAAVFWARRLGAGRIAATAASTRRAELAGTMGADVFLDPENATPQDAARALGGMPDVVFECVGKPGMIQRCIDYVRLGGTVVVLGLCTKEERFMPFAALHKECRLQWSAFWDIADFTRAVDVLDRGAAEPGAMVTDEVGLGQMPDAFEGLKHRTHQCKILVAP